MSEYVIRYRHGREFDGLVIPAGSREADVVAYIIGGHVPGGIARVDHYDVEEDWAHNVTEDVARACSRQAAADGECSRWLYEFIETFAPGCERGLRVWDRTFTAA